VRVQLRAQGAQLGLARADLRLEHAALGLVRGLEGEIEVVGDRTQEVERDARHQQHEQVLDQRVAREPGRVHPALERHAPERTQRDAHDAGLERGRELGEHRLPQRGALHPREGVPATHPPCRQHDERGEDLQRHRERQRRGPRARLEQPQQPRQRHARERRQGEDEQQSGRPGEQRVHAISPPVAAAVAAAAAGLAAPGRRRE
jgi:hypothetical protein